MGRAGSYITQATGYRAFIPAPLPPSPAIQMEGELQLLLSRADMALGRLDGSVQTLPNPDLFVLMYVRKEAVLSSQIEGTQSSLQDLLAVEAQALGRDRIARDVDEVVNYVKAMRHGLDRLASLPVSVRLIREIHEQLMTGGRGGQLAPGELRTSQNWIGPSGVTLSDAAFVPPPPHEVASSLSDLERYIHSDDTLPLLVRIGLAHAQFETIHPFLDGNGRVGRLLITLLLCERAVLAQPVLYLSIYLKRHRSEYYERLQAVRDQGDWEGWLRFFLRGVEEVSIEATETARRIIAMREAHRILVTAKLGRGAATGHRVLESLYARPITSVQEARETLGLTTAAANNVMARLVELGLLVEITGNKRHRRFRYEPYVALFSSESAR
jgi:Fic family protein